MLLVNWYIRTPLLLSGKIPVVGWIMVKETHTFLDWNKYSLSFSSIFLEYHEYTSNNGTHIITHDRLLCYVHAFFKKIDFKLHKHTVKTMCINVEKEVEYSFLLYLIYIYVVDLNSYFAIKKNYSLLANIYIGARNMRIRRL